MILWRLLSECEFVAVVVVGWLFILVFIVGYFGFIVVSQKRMLREKLLIL